MIGLPLAILATVVAVFTMSAANGAVPAGPATNAATAPVADQQPDQNCTLIVPANPLSATGLATPYAFTATRPSAGPCHEADTDQSAFVEATIVDPATGALSVYRPLVIDRGTRPAAAPLMPKLPTDAVVGLWFGFNAGNLTLRGAGSSACVNGLHGSLFSQVAYCNAPPFFAAANAAIGRGRITVPQLGTATNGQPCMTTRDFGLIDQDQSDNVDTSYLVLPDGRVAQNSAADAARLTGAQVLVNGSDNLLLDGFVDPALGCQPFTVPDLTNPGTRVSSLALDELLAAARQPAPAALVPLNDPMTEIDGAQSTAKTNLYRVGVDQPSVGSAGQSPSQYCRDMVTIGIRRTALDKALTSAAPSPDTGAATNLFTFLAQRLGASFTNLGCGDLLHLADPVRVRTNKAGVAVAVTFIDH
ncbi:MAG TPA: hypothetical protein VHX38_11185 [Pseudonocardiaceae bacterium]|nr:hypothetical protein [Pseudonocardiaceae bacterium]